MGVVRAETENKLTLVVNAGTAEAPSYKNRIFNHFDPNLDDDLCYEVVDKLGALQAHTVEKRLRTEISELVKE